MTQLDYIIVGQGIAGSTLAFRMLEEGLNIRVIDPCPEVSGSLMAAGIVNPITGRKLVKSWRIDELLVEVCSLYSRFEKLLGQQFLYTLPIYKLFHHVKEQNDWMARKNQPGYEAYMSGVELSERIGIHAPHGIGTIRNAHWLKIDMLIRSFRDYLLQRDLLLKENFIYDELRLEYRISYKEWSAKGIIFCEGYRGRTNPYFKGLPLASAKGEIMTVHCPSLHWLDGILNRNGFVIPLGDDLYRVGATFQRDDTSEQPSETGRADLIKRFESLVSLPYTITDIQAAFRPTSKDRRPMLGRSPIHPAVHIFNGLGTKGVSLAAYFSNHLLQVLESGQTLDPEVDVLRFKEMD